MSYALRTEDGKYVRFVGHAMGDRWRPVGDVELSTIFDSEDEALDAQLYVDAPTSLTRTRVEPALTIAADQDDHGTVPVERCETCEHWAPPRHSKQGELLGFCSCPAASHDNDRCPAVHVCDFWQPKDALMVALLRKLEEAISTTKPPAQGG